MWKTEKFSSRISFTDDVITTPACQRCFRPNKVR
jgi:hypothetical protein